MLYIRLCFDKAGQLELRESTRAEHRAYVMPILAPTSVPRLVQGGPLCVSDADDTNIASFMILEADNIEQVKRFHEGDPFTKAGLYEQVYIHRWDKHVG
ncbi:YciI family protein [Trinickia violacea]|uniref:YciI family protein n=1 Tax=Trinickia violacea TaxID=2571746 RepID=A0A4V1EI45_9BURK|nr:YciI family protein [Trinickia violacea]QCP52490.1 YciI family protein [Trinickia violacea]